MDILLNIRVAILRFLLNYNEGLERKQQPQPPEPTFIETIPSSSKQGTVPLHFYAPPDFEKVHHGRTVKTKYPLVIDFHGGGFTAGRPSINARWIAALLASDASPVVVGVDYGLAPANPFPGPVQDAVAAILWLANEGAEKYALDAERIVLTGFSAGGTLVLTAPMWMQEEHDGSSGRGLPYPLRGVVSVYLGIDFRVPRKPAASMLGRFLSGTWDQAFYERSPLDSPFVSPAAATDDQLKTSLPPRVGLYPVEIDDLMKPCEDLRERLKGLGKHVTGDVEPGVIHGWDKYPIKEGDAAKWEKREAWFSRMARDVESMLKA